MNWKQRGLSILLVNFKKAQPGLTEISVFARGRGCVKTYKTKRIEGMVSFHVPSGEYNVQVFYNDTCSYSSLNLTVYPIF